MRPARYGLSASGDLYCKHLLIWLLQATKKVEAAALEAVTEHNEATESQSSPQKAADTATMASPNKSSATVPETPKDSSPVKPNWSEMHPSKAHHTTGAVSPGFILGFTDIKANDKTRGHAPTCATPTPTPAKPDQRGPEFTFRAPLPKADLDLELSSDARRIMDELRDKAQKIKADLVAKQQEEQTRRAQDPITGRKIAMPKGKAGRFSAAHMAEFKKMDSIENHPSAFRAQNNRLATPLSKGGLKRSPSKANLDDNDPAVLSKTTPAIAAARAAHATEGRSTGSKRVRQLLEDDVSTSRPNSRDGSSIPRPKSRGKDAAAMPRSQSSLASLMSPTKSSLARTVASKPGSQESLLSSSTGSLGVLPKSRTTGNLTSVPKKEETKPEVVSSGRFERVKSMFRSAPKASAKPPVKAPSGIPLPSGASKTPGLQRSVKAPQMPLTTPGRKLQKRIAITPQTNLATLAQNSPLVFKSGVPRSPTRAALGDITYPSLSAVMELQGAGKETVSYPDLSRHLNESSESVELAAADGESEVTERLPPTVPGTFTFRSDHTIKFGNAPPSGFGSSPGQASVRHVRPSILPSEGMPGSFPSRLSSLNIFGKRQSTSSNKENVEPSVEATKPPVSSSKKKLAIPVSRMAVKGASKVAHRDRVFLYDPIPHGIPNKKRHRDVAWDEDEKALEEEQEHRAAKKRRDNSELPDAAALLAPHKLAAEKSSAVTGLETTSPAKMSTSGVAARSAVGTGAGGSLALALKSPSPVKTMSSVPGSRSPTKKKAVLSISRLNMLARPKYRV